MKPRLEPSFCAANGIVITGEEGDEICFGLLDGGDRVLKARVEKTYPAWRCRFEPITRDEFNLKLSRLYAEELPAAETGGGNDTGRETAIDRVSDDAPVINLLNSIFLEALSRRASDIHLESGKGESRLRYRIDGMLLPVRDIPTERAAAVSARLKLLANLNVIETRRPQDGHLDITAETYSLDVRISIVPTIWGESVVLRLLSRSDTSFSLDSLGFTVQHQLIITKLLSITAGLILVTGPTGSGKTTTLAALLKELRKNNAKIISIEDPVEYRIEGVTQLQVNEELSLSFDALLRRIFRQDPDIIMVGEIRDTETAELAVRAALTGHLVFATLHTNNAAEAIYRLNDMGIPPYLVAAVLRAVIAQRLVRTLCTACSGSGCSLCSMTGYYGRTVVAEIITVDTPLAEQLAQGIRPEPLRVLLTQRQYSTLYDDALAKVEEGRTTRAEVQRELGL
jgi:type II secretory ATPase GspE/PulE/Tfp pilus assembly ATPase PilB-like protein